MSIDEIKELIRVVQETGIAELELQRGENKVRIRRTAVPAADIVVPIVPAPVAAQQQIATNPTVTTSAVATPVHSEDDRNTVIKSPIVGTFYDAPSPGSAPFVKVGDQIHPKQVLCIIESMKLMNEIEAEVAGTVVAKLVENGRPVEYGESLFTVRPL